MSLLFVFLLTAFTSIEASKNKTYCNETGPDFDMKSAIGPWFVAAIVPGKMFPDKEVTCFMVEFSETDQAGLRWLINKTVDSHEKLSSLITGTIVRQRYHTEQPLDVWSRGVGSAGCFRLVLSLDADQHPYSDITKAITQETFMQLYAIETQESGKKQPYLIQMLWGRMITAVIYGKNKFVTQDQLRTPFEFISKLRGPQRLPRVCKKYHKYPLTADSL